MKHTLLKSLGLAAVAGFIAGAPAAQAIVLPPTGYIGPIAGNDQDMNQYSDCDCTLAQVYKMNYDGLEEEGVDPDLFSTEFTLDDDDEVVAATLTLTGQNPSLYDWDCFYVVVKSGKNGFVYYPVTNWDYENDPHIEVTNAGLGQSISHVSVWACRTPDQNVPEGGASVALLGLGLAGLGLSRRFLAKKA